MKLFTDAAVNGNPGSSGIGFVFQDDSIYKQVSTPLKGEWDNHTAEFEAVFHGLTWIIKNHHTNSFLILYTDSKLVSDSIDKKYAKNAIFAQYVKKILPLLSLFELYEVKWIPSSQNRGADHLARHGLQKALKTQKKNEKLNPKR